MFDVLDMHDVIVAHIKPSDRVTCRVINVFRGYVHEK
jgi:hypothetical protein